MSILTNMESCQQCMLKHGSRPGSKHTLHLPSSTRIFPASATGFLKTFMRILLKMAGVPTRPPSWPTRIEHHAISRPLCNVLHCYAPFQHDTTISRSLGTFVLSECIRQICLRGQHNDFCFMTFVVRGGFGTSSASDDDMLLTRMRFDRAAPAGTDS